VVNDAIVTELETEHPEGGWVENSTINTSIDLLFKPFENNDFRQHVLD
jgi:hypothetical protein